MNSRMFDDKIDNPARNKRPLRTEKMRREGWEGVAMAVPISLIVKGGVPRGGKPFYQPIERDLLRAVALKYAGLFTRLQACDQRKQPNNPSPQYLRDDEIQSQIKSSCNLPYKHASLVEQAERAARKDPRFGSQKAFNDAHRRMNVGISTDFFPRAPQNLSIAEHMRILGLLCKAHKRARLMCKRQRKVFKISDRYGEARSDSKQSALERDVLLSPEEQEQLSLTLEDMTDIAFHAWVNPSLICLDHYILSPVFEAAICASRCRDGIPGEMTRFSAMVLNDVLEGKLSEFCLDDAMFESCLGIYSALLNAFNANTNFNPEDFKACMQKQLADAIETPGRLEDNVTIHPLAPTPATGGL